MAQLAGNSGVPDAASRFAAAQLGKKPTLVLDKTSLDFGKAVYSKGAMSQSEFKKINACSLVKIRIKNLVKIKSWSQCFRSILESRGSRM